MPAGQGFVALTFPAGVASDGLNGNLAGVPSVLTVRYASIPPAYTISPLLSLTSSNPVFVVSWDQPVQTFSNAQRNALIFSAVTNAAAVVIAAVGGNNYTITVVPAGQGIVSLLFPANAALDQWGINYNLAARSPLSIQYDSVGPVPTLATVLSPTNQPPVFSVAFSEAVSGFTQALCGVALLSSCTNCASVNLVPVGSGGSSFSITVVPAGQGTVSIFVPAGVINDSAGNPNPVTPVVSIVYSTVGPTFLITAPSPSNEVVFTVTFSTVVTDFTDSQDNSAILAAMNNTYSCVIAPVGVSGASFTITASPIADGIVALLFPANVATNGLNGNLEADGPLLVRVDRVAPVCTVAALAGTITRLSPIVFQISCSEPMQQFSQAALQAACSNVVSSSLGGAGSLWLLSVIPAGQGPVTLLLPAGSGIDLAGNAVLPAALIASIIYDTVGPAYTISVLRSPTNELPVFHVRFFETVSGFSNASAYMALMGVFVNARSLTVCTINSL
jgi:hypothetical protein